MEYAFFNRDLSWLSFNERVLEEASQKEVPIMERMKFLAIYSSNLDEFYRVRIPTLMAIEQTENDTESMNRLWEVQQIVQDQQDKFGRILENEIIPELSETFSVEFLYKKDIPDFLRQPLTNYFFNMVAAFLQLVYLEKEKKFFPENSKLYILVLLEGDAGEEVPLVVNIPSDHLPRFYSVEYLNQNYIIFLDDIVKLCLHHILPDQKILSFHNLKITRSGDLEVEDEYEGDLVDKIQKVLEKRDFGLATRLLYQGNIGKETLKIVRKKFGLSKASFVRGGSYHNLKDLANLPLKDPAFYYKPLPQRKKEFFSQSIFDVIRAKPFFIHTPYDSFSPLIRFFNEASVDPSVTAIYTTIYRIAKNSVMAHALINAARNGKKVYVFVELKARFDEENNLKWARKIEDAGARIIFSLPGLKVHCKIALVQRKRGNQKELFALLGSGNFHESNASLYTDHFLFTADTTLCSEVRLLFSFLKAKKKGLSLEKVNFRKLLVGQFNLQDSFIELIEREIDHARAGTAASIIVKVNALEDKVLINKLYIASKAGVKITLIVRGICCLVPGIPGQSENITVKRVIDRYLEHGRIFIFGNAGDPLLFVGSSDWMSRSMYRRIEVCFPVEEPELKDEILQIVDFLQLDNMKAVSVDETGRNITLEKTGEARYAQQEISNFICKRD